MNKNIVIINTFPNTEIKQEMLFNQIVSLNKLGYKTLIISGCDIPKETSNLVDYYFVNKITEKVGKDFTYNLIESNLNTTTAWFDIGDKKIHCYFAHSHSTISQNLKIGFEIAKKLGFTTALYAEDDNVFNEESFSLINQSLSRINDGDSKMCGVKLTIDYLYDITYTTFFISDIEFLLKIYQIPTNVSDWYDFEQIKRCNLNKTIEGVFNDFILPHIEHFHNIDKEVLILEKNGGLKTNTYTRYQNEDFLIDVFMNMLPNTDGSKSLFLINQSHYLLLGQKPYSISVYYDDIFMYDVFLEFSNNFFITGVSENVKSIKLLIDGWGEKIIDTSFDTIKYNGKIIEN